MDIVKLYKIYSQRGLIIFVWIFLLSCFNSVSASVAGAVAKTAVILPFRIVKGVVKVTFGAVTGAATGAVKGAVHGAPKPQIHTPAPVKTFGTVLMKAPYKDLLVPAAL